MKIFFRGERITINNEQEWEVVSCEYDEQTLTHTLKIKEVIKNG